jgi:hypothetical protein
MPRQWLRAIWSRKRDRRQRQRIARYFECSWLSPWGEEQSRVSSLSPTGCYIENRSSVPPEGAAVPELIVALPSGTINLRGTVVEATPGIGFAVRFTALDADTRDRLSALVQGASR